MFIATNQYQNLFAPLGAKHRQQGIGYADVALLRSAVFFGQHKAINISPLRGEDNAMACCTSKLNSRLSTRY